MQPSCKFANQFTPIVLPRPQGHPNESTINCDTTAPNRWAYCSTSRPFPTPSSSSLWQICHAHLFALSSSSSSSRGVVLLSTWLQRFNLFTLKCHKFKYSRVRRLRRERVLLKGKKRPAGAAYRQTCLVMSHAPKLHWEKELSGSLFLERKIIIFDIQMLLMVWLYKKCFFF